MGEPADFCCPLSCVLLQDPVSIKGEPSHYYERKFIQEWFDECERKGKPITSPMTRKVVQPKLVENKILKQKLIKEWHKSALDTSIVQNDSSIHALREVFSHLDQLRDLLAKTLSDWQPPQVVVLGQQSSGKSSLLERLAMMSLFPRADDMCTKVPIHLRMRNSETAKVPTIEVFNVKDSRIEDGPHMIPMEWGSIEVSKKMDEIMSKETTGAGVSADRVIIVRFEGPLVPSIDLVDMPGLVQAPAALAEQTLSLVKNQIAKHGDYSMYLVVVTGGEDVSNSPAMRVVQDGGLHAQTLGVFTMCDELTPGSRKVNVLRRALQQEQEGADKNPGSDLRYGWVATSCEPCDGESSRARLKRQTEKEKELCEVLLPDAMRAGRATCGAVVTRVGEMYLQYVRETWAPTTLLRFKTEMAKVEADDAALGVPAFGPDSDRTTARKLAVSEARRITESIYSTITQECCREVVEPLRQRVFEAIVPRLEKVVVGDVGARWEAERSNVKQICIDTATAWVNTWKEKLRRALAGDDEHGVVGSKRPRAGTGSGFRLDRFPAFVDAVVGQAVELLGTCKAMVLADVDECVAAFYATASPWASYELRLTERPATVDVARDGAALAGRVAMAFARFAPPGLTALTEALEPAAAGVEDWAEACAEERMELLDRKQKLQRAREGIMELLQLGQKLTGHEGEVWTVAWSPDGRRLATGGTDGTVRVWDAANRSEINRLPVAVGSRVVAVGWSPDGKKLACGLWSKKVMLYNGDTLGDGKVLELPAACACIAWSPDNMLLAAGCVGRSEIILFEISSGCQKRILTFQPEKTGRNCYSTWTLVLAFSPDGRFLASAGLEMDHVVRLYDLQKTAVDAGPAGVLRGHTNVIYGLAWSPDGSLLASLSYDDTVKLWGISGCEGNERASLQCPHPIPCQHHGISFSPDGRLLAAPSGDELRVFDVAAALRGDSVIEAAVLTGHTSMVWAAVFSPDGRRLASASKDGTARVWDAPLSLPPPPSSSGDGGSGGRRVRARWAERAAAETGSEAGGGDRAAGGEVKRRRPILIDLGGA
jgi:WD40 repeat protein